MVYLNFVFGLGVVLAAAAAAVYFSWPNYPQAAPHRQTPRNRRDEDKEFDQGARLHRNFRDQRLRRSVPGDRCPVCLLNMEQRDMHHMKCGHALDNACFEDYRYLRRNCPLCNQTVNLSLPGDSCSICFDPLEKNNMVHLRCQHALHSECFQQFMNSGAKTCPLCREQL
ncbi:uncharacterized protein LOC108043971 [Drosophila rhopaloa]|uniref:Uncharacterized protein LOC108043971 n=1 Tax=Drosophila rhopaloa TaxID=1041015 RepID=A0A6P4EP42_DRORH|nr:uncharacterized protein LOC108043971 [Drosophila rhopaloa]XP_016978409.1 uncharacterized protein LOC108043971 [Drosophila rhopaloa]